MNALVTDWPPAMASGDLPPAFRQGAVRALFLGSEVLGWQVSNRQWIAATADRDDILAVHVLLRPPLWMKILNRRVPGVRPHLIHHNVTWKWLLKRWLTGRLDARRFDVIHCNPQVMAFAAATLKSRYRYKLSMSCDTTDLQYRQEVCGNPSARSVGPDRKVFQSADLILPLSTWCANSLTTDYGIPPEKLLLTRPSAPVPAEVPPKRPRDGRLLRIAFVGNDFVRKGGEKLLKWHQERWADRVELHVASAEAADHAPAKNVYFLGRLDHPKVLALLDSADLLVHPTQADMSALVVAEAQARGVPAVASRIAGIPDLLHDGVSGYLVGPKDDAGFIAAVERVLFNEPRHAAMSTAARQFALQNLDSATTYRRVVDALVALASG
ncbi:MAG: glycosyltransferase family 4 protein [Tepidisphaeraceae bacterium]